MVCRQRKAVSVASLACLLLTLSGRQRFAECPLCAKSGHTMRFGFALKDFVAVRFALDGRVLSGILWILRLFGDWRKDGLQARLGQVRAKDFFRKPIAGTMDSPEPVQSNINSANGPAPPHQMAP